jgi:hypothetical protein
VRERPHTYARRPNYVFLEAQNSQLGRAGEEFVINVERARLISSGQSRLVESVQHVSVTRGDFEGFDVLSFGDRGEERFIEVKTTKSGADTPFYVTRNELARSREDADRYHVYRVFAFRQRPKLFTLPGAVDRTCELNPTTYIARVS